MGRNAGDWSDLDRECMRLISEMRKAHGTPSYRAMEEGCGIKFNRIHDLLNCLHGTPTMDELVALCHYFGHPASETLITAMANLGIDDEGTRHRA